MENPAPPSVSSVSEYPSESTKSDSNVSKRSEIEYEVNVEDSGLTPIDMESHIQAEHITKSLDNLVYRAKLALCIPTLLHDPVLSDILSEQHLSDVRCICKQHDNPLFSASLLNMAAMEDIQAGDMSLKHRLSPELGFMMYALSSYQELKPCVEMITKKIEQPPPGLPFLLKLEELHDLMVVKMTNTAAQELALKIRTRKLEGSNKKELAKIAEYSKCLKEETKDLEKEMAKKTELIAHLRQEVRLLGHKNLYERKKQILDSERQMVLAKRAHNVKYQMLREEEVETRDNYNTTLQNHVMAEKNLRLRRNKVETQLLTWMQKYDAEIGAKQEELDDLTKQYEDEVKLKKELEIKLAEQDKEFIPLMEEKEQEYHAEMEEKLQVFMVEHAARVIQNAWRQINYNRAEKNKLLKLKRKQDLERQAAARQAELEAKKAAEEERKRAAAARKAEKQAAKLAKLEAKNAPKPEES